MRKKRVVFPIVRSLIFREKASKSHAKRMKTILVHKNRQKITRGTLLFRKKTIFSEFLGSPGSPGASWDDPENTKNRSLELDTVKLALHFEKYLSHLYKYNIKIKLTQQNNIGSSANLLSSFLAREIENSNANFKYKYKIP